MPKHRLIATLLVDAGRVVQTRQFKRTNMVGSAFTAVDFFNGWTVDEIIVLDRGHVVQRGTHAELLTQEGLYRTIFDLELKDQEEALGAYQGPVRVEFVS